MLSRLFASSRLAGRIISGFLAPADSLVLCEATERGTPPPLMEWTLLLEGVEMIAGGGSSTDSGVLGESCGARLSRMLIGVGSV